MAQDWSSSEPLVEGSSEWEAREEEYFQKEQKEMMDALNSGQDLYAFELPSLNQNFVDSVTGFGDTFGAGYIRNWIGIEGGVDYDSNY
jgi:hypothetical protein